VLEWLKRQHWKCCLRETVTRVRIPPAPLTFLTSQCHSYQPSDRISSRVLYSAIPEKKVLGREPDVTTVETATASLSQSGVATRVQSRPIAQGIMQVESESAYYARKANRIAIYRGKAQVVAIIEIVSPGNKNSREDFESFVSKLVEFLERNVSVLVIDLFSPTSRDPDGVHSELWVRVSNVSPAKKPADKPLTVASYDTGPELTSYVNNLAVRDVIPNMPLFIGPGHYVTIPLQALYDNSWNELPELLRDEMAQVSQ
jgi:hypothetical protein